MAKIGSLIIDTLHLVALNKDGGVKAGPVELYSKLINAVITQSLFESSITMTLTIVKQKVYLQDSTKRVYLAKSL